MSSLLLPPPGSKSRVLRHLRHMLPLTKQPLGKFANKVPSYMSKGNNFVQPHDRIPYWNIVPGDEVLVKKGWVKKEEDGKVVHKRYQGVVSSIDRERNLVYLRPHDSAPDDSLVPKHKKSLSPSPTNPEDLSEGFQPNMVWIPKPIHYSNLQLKLPEDLKLPGNIKLDLKAGVYASRLLRSKVKYDPRRGFFVWKRFAIVHTKNDTLQIEVPWKKSDSPPQERRPNSSIARTVDRETWIPWRPTDPVWLLPPKQRTSQQAIERYEALLRNRASSQRVLKSSEMAKRIAALRSKGRPVYEGFLGKNKGVKPPPVPQPPTPAEQVYFARKEAARWAAGLDLSDSGNTQSDEHVPQRAFSAIDYLALAPLDGPSSAEGQRGFGATNSEQKHTQTSTSGHLTSPDQVSKQDVDSWPIELMMKDDLINERGLRHRMRRWHVRQEQSANVQRALAQEEQANLQALRSLEL